MSAHERENDLNGENERVTGVRRNVYACACVGTYGWMNASDTHMCARPCVYVCVCVYMRVWTDSRALEQTTLLSALLL